MKRLKHFLRNRLETSVSFTLLHVLFRFIKVRVRSKSNVQDLRQLKQAKRKQKLAIIGCGPSINQLDDHFFSSLTDYDVAALSYAALLPVNIDFYFYEMPRGELLAHHKHFLYPELRRKRQHGLLHNVVLKHNATFDNTFIEAFPDAITSMTFPIHLRAPKKLNQLLDILDITRLSSRYFFQIRASLFSSCYWADKIGYDEILLVGVDLNSSHYFYEEPNKWIKTLIPNPYEETERKAGTHPTNDPAKGIKMTDALHLLKKRLSAQISITSEHSALSPMFEVKSSRPSESAAHQITSKYGPKK